MPECQYCKSENFRVIEASFDPYRVLKCESCEIVFVHPKPKMNDLKNHYDNEYYSDWIDQQRPKRMGMWQKRLNKINRAKPAGRLLDIGCGEGLFIKIAQENGWDVEGTEISEYASKVASEATDKQIWHGELWGANYPAASFDVVTIWHVLEHMADPIRTLREARRVLKKDGLCIVAVPNVNDLIMQLAYLLVRRKKQVLFTPDDKELHLFHFSRRTLQSFLRQAGFKSVRIGPDFGIIDYGKKVVNTVSVIPYYVAGIHIYNGLEAQARP